MFIQDTCIFSCIVAPIYIQFCILYPAPHTRNLHSCSQLTDASVAQLVARVGAGLRSLNLSGCKQVGSQVSIRSSYSFSF